MACRLPYIDQQPFSETEKQRLFKEHNQIIKEAKASKAFRTVNGRLQTVSTQYPQATVFSKRINDRFGFNNITSLKPIGNGQYTLFINVLPLSIEQQGSLFQLNQQSAKGPVTPLISALPEVNNKVVSLAKDLLTKMGVDHRGVAEIVVNGTKLGANGAAYITQKLVEVVEGKETEALPEETMHFLVEIIEQTNPTLLRRLLSDINSYNIYQEVLRDYSDVYRTPEGKPDIRKLKKEAIAKQLVNTIINKLENEETYENIARAQTWWSQILEWFKNLFKKAAFDSVAISIIKGDMTGTVEDLPSIEETYFQLETNIEKQTAIWNKIKDVQKRVIKGKDEEGYTTLDGKKVTRVTDITKSWYERRFDDNQLTQTDYDKALNDLKKEKGTMGHSYLEDAFALFVDENGYLREEALDDSDFLTQLTPTNRKIYEILRDNLKERLLTFPNDTRFLSESIIYDENRNIAGTVDFMAITPEGKVNILDWKFMALDTKNYEDVPWYKVQAWRLQMDQYKLIVSNVYGVPNQDFEQTRMIPIQANYTQGNRKKKELPKLKSIKIGDVKVDNIKEDYLLPVSTQTEKTIDRRIDDLLEKLNSLYKHISDKRAIGDEDKKNKAEQLNALFSAIRQLQMKTNLKPLVYQASVFNKNVLNLIQEYKNKWEKEDPRSFEEAEITAFYNELMSVYNTISTYSDLDVELGFLFLDRENMNEEDKKLEQDLSEASKQARTLSNELKHITTSFVDTIYAPREDIKGSLLAPEKPIKGHTRWFSTTATIPLKALELIYKAANAALFRAHSDNLQENRRLQELKKEYDEWASSQNLTSSTYFDILKKKDKNELIDEFNPEFYSLLRQKTKEKNYKWIRENIDEKAFKNRMKEALDKEIERIERQRVLGTTVEDVKIKGQIRKARILYDVSEPTSPGWLMYSELRKFPLREKWESAEWKKLNIPTNAPAKKFYDYIIERNNHYANIGYIAKERARTFLPFVRAEVAEKLRGGDVSSLGENFLRSISIDEGDVGYGQIDPFTKRPIDTIPKYFTQKVDGKLSNYLFRNMAAYNEAALKYGYMSQIEGIPTAVLQTERNKKSIATSWFGRTEYRDGQLVLNPANEKNSKLVEDMVKAIFYGQKYIVSDSFDQLLTTLGNFGEKVNNKFGFKLLPENVEGRQVSVNKSIDMLNNTFQLVALGFSPLAALSNLLGGSFQSMINAGTYFTKTDFARNEAWLTMQKMTGLNREKRIAALEYFLPLTDNYNREIARRLSGSKVSQENLQDLLMIMMRKSDWLIQTANFFSYLDNTIVTEDNRVVNVRTYLRENNPEFQNMYVGSSIERQERKDKFEKEVERLIEARGVLKIAEIKDGVMSIPGVDPKSRDIINLRRQVQQISKNALGNLSEDDLRPINMTVYGKSFMVFKNWIPRLVDVRAGNLKYNAASDAYEWGRYRTLFRVIADDTLKSLSNLVNIFRGSDKGVEYMRTLYEKKRAEYQQDTNKELYMDEGQFMDLVRNNIRNQLLDTLFLLSLFSLFIGLKALAPDDDEEDLYVKNSHKFLLKAVDKIKDELWFFYDPTSITSLVSSGIFPSIGFINNLKTAIINFGKEMYGITFENEEIVEETHVTKYIMRSFPVVNQGSLLLPIFYPDMAKDLGIRMSTEARAGAR